MFVFVDFMFIFISSTLNNVPSGSNGFIICTRGQGFPGFLAVQSGTLTKSLQTNTVNVFKAFSLPHILTCYSTYEHLNTEYLMEPSHL